MHFYASFDESLNNTLLEEQMDVADQFCKKCEATARYLDSFVYDPNVANLSNKIIDSLMESDDKSKLTMLGMDGQNVNRAQFYLVD